MTELFAAVSGRLKTIFTVHAALELEAELILAHIERRATFLRQAAQLEAEGMTDLASDLRRHAQEMDPSRPAESVLSALPQGLLPSGQNGSDRPEKESDTQPAPLVKSSPEVKQQNTSNGSSRKKAR